MDTDHDNEGGKVRTVKQYRCDGCRLLVTLQPCIVCLARSAAKSKADLERRRQQVAKRPPTPPSPDFAEHARRWADRQHALAVAKSVAATSPTPPAPRPTLPGTLAERARRWQDRQIG